MAVLRRAAISLFRPRPPRGKPDLDHVARLLVVRAHDQLGDFLLITPALRSLRLRFPSARITLAVSPFLAPLAAHQPDVDRVLVITDFAPPRGGPYDVALVLNTISHSLTSDLAARRSGARSVIGPSRPELKDVPGAPLYDWAYEPAEPAGPHQMDQALAVVAPLGCPDVAREYRYGMTEGEEAFGRRVRSRFPAGPLLAMHVGTKDPARRYPEEQWAEVLERVARASGAYLVLLDAPDAREARDRVASLLGVPHTVLDPMSLRELAAVLSTFDLLLCHDSAPMHLAAAVGSGTVAVGGRDDARRWKPPGSRHVALESSDRVPAHVAPADFAEAAIDLLGRV
ncbi:MAG TPA: glycosyltransferase family 9 protein [Candidatus Eisenbacteria bacterium]|nr:glycosyltransferase family 9 protein [Candidatus Eisenbacteria bacterium]